DHFALLAIGLLAKSLEHSFVDGTDINARADVMLGASAAGMAFGTAGTALAHAIQYPLGADTHTAHGLGVACLLPYVMTYNRAVAMPELAAIGRAMGVIGTSDAELADAAIARVAELFAAIGIPANLNDLGMDQARIDWTATQALTIGRLIDNNPRPIDAAGMNRLVHAAFAGDRSLAL
ncbi:MAG: alcohol dehydrogenase iron-type protein, partial [Devosia sp.]|nr:alcohol dehydrogenase iron-type protein [Devosia sp.]